jgi:hypothetical protein
LGLVKAVFGIPLVALGMAVALKLSAWLFDTKSKFALLFSASALALTPLAVRDLLCAGTILAHAGVTLSQAHTLIPTSLGAVLTDVPPLASRLLRVVDFFYLWSALLLGLGLAAASEMRKGRAVLLGLALYLSVFMVSLGIPSHGGGPG